MRRFIISSIFVLSPLAATQASVTIALTIGQLETSSQLGIPDNSLVQLIVDTDGNGFTAPSVNSFVGGSADDVIIDSFGINSATAGGVLGDSSTSYDFTLSNYNVASGESILLRWWPTLTTSAMAPGSGTAYGQSPVDLDWVLPADGGTANLSFITQSQGGSQANSAGVASSKVVPEPGTFALTAFGVAAMLAARKSRKRRD